MILFTCHNSIMCNSMYKKGELTGVHSQILTTRGKGGGGGGGPREVYILYPKKSQLQNLSVN